MQALFIIFVLIGVDARPEWHTSGGRIDLLLSMRNYIYIIELKRDGTPDEALEQIRRKDYARQFAADPRPVVTLGITFSTTTRNITARKSEYPARKQLTPPDKIYCFYCPPV